MTPRGEIRAGEVRVVDRPIEISRQEYEKALKERRADERVGYIACDFIEDPDSFAKVLEEYRPTVVILRHTYSRSEYIEAAKKIVHYCSDNAAQLLISYYDMEQPTDSERAELEQLGAIYHFDAFSDGHIYTTKANKAGK